MIIQDPQFYLVAIPAVLIYGMGKGGLGGAVGAISVPLMALVIDPIRAAAILLPIICIMDLHVMKLFWQSFDRAILKIIVPAALFGVVIGSLLLGSLPVAYIKIMIGAIAVGFCLSHWFAPESNTGTHGGGKLSGYFWGFVAGFTSTHIHAGGPPISIYLLPKKLDKLVLVGTLGFFFAILNFVKLIPYYMLDQFDWSILITAVVLMPLAPIGVALGYKLLHVVRQEVLYAVVYICLFLTGLKLTYDGLIA